MGRGCTNRLLTAVKSRRRDYFTPARRVGVGAGLPAKLDSLPPIKAFGGKLQGNDTQLWQSDRMQKTSRHPRYKHLAGAGEHRDASPPILSVRCNSFPR